jgi:hypothetical protein
MRRRSESTNRECSSSVCSRSALQLDITTSIFRELSKRLRRGPGPTPWRCRGLIRRHGLQARELPLFDRPEGEQELPAFSPHAKVRNSVLADQPPNTWQRTTKPLSDFGDYEMDGMLMRTGHRQLGEKVMLPPFLPNRRYQRSPLFHSRSCLSSGFLARRRP